MLKISLYTIWIKRCFKNIIVDPLEPEVLKIGRKVPLDTDFIQTQFDIEKTKTVLKEVEKCGCPVLIGIFPLKSYGIADFFNRFIPGVSVPQELMENMRNV